MPPWQNLPRRVPKQGIIYLHSYSEDRISVILRYQWQVKYNVALMYNKYTINNDYLINNIQL